MCCVYPIDRPLTRDAHPIPSPGKLRVDGTFKNNVAADGPAIHIETVAEGGDVCENSLRYCSPAYPSCFGPCTARPRLSAHEAAQCWFVPRQHTSRLERGQICASNSSHTELHLCGYSPSLANVRASSEGLIWDSKTSSRHPTRDRSFILCISSQLLADPILAT